MASAAFSGALPGSITPPNSLATSPVETGHVSTTFLFPLLSTVIQRSAYLSQAEPINLCPWNLNHGTHTIWTEQSHINDRHLKK